LAVPNLPISIVGDALADRPLEDLDGWALDLLRDARVARLGLLDSDGRPRVLPITYVLADGVLWTAIDSKPKRTDREPARVQFLRRRPEVAVTVDRYEDDWSRLAWVQVLGRATLHEGAEEAGALAALTEKYQQYRADPPPGPLISIEPERVLAWRGS
jgi:PPOX class probable F420-dependent enzyme